MIYWLGLNWVAVATCQAHAYVNREGGKEEHLPSLADSQLMFVQILRLVNVGDRNSTLSTYKVVKGNTED